MSAGNIKGENRLLSAETVLEKSHFKTESRKIRTERRLNKTVQWTGRRSRPVTALFVIILVLSAIYPLFSDPLKSFDIILIYSIGIHDFYQ